MAYKKCKQCEKECGVRTHTCECGYSFLNSIKGIPVERITEIVQDVPAKVEVSTPTKKRRKKKKKKWVRVNWKELSLNDIIMVRGGPYFLTKTGEKIPMSSKGRFRVKAVEETGLACYDIDYGGFEFVYCGPEYLAEETGIIKRPHRIKKWVGE